MSLLIFQGTRISNPDFAQAMAEKGAAAWIANTGFGYGMDDAATHSEQLYLNLTQQLGTEENKPLGKALVEAKQRYLGNAAAAGFGSYDEKILIEATLYGLPMTTVDLPAAPQSVPINPDIVDFPTAQGYLFTLSPQPQSSSVQTGDYYSLGGDVHAAPGRPIQPSGTFALDRLSLSNVRGAVLLSAAYNELTAFEPLIARPIWDDLAGETEPIFDAPGWFPTKLWSINRFGDQDQLVIIGGQYNNTTQVERLYTSMEFAFLTADANSVDYAPPSILYAAARESNGGIEFLVSAFDEEGLNQVWVTYQDGNGWVSVPLQQANGAWSAFVAGLEKDTPFFVQACDTSGNCSAKLDKNEYLVGSPPPQFVNRVGEEHTFTIGVWKDPGICAVDGLTPGRCLIPAEGIIPDVSLVDANGAAIPPTGWNGSCKTGTGADGTCTVIINSTQPGPISVSATAEIQVLTKVLQRSTDGQIGNSLDATKIYVDASLSLLSTSPGLLEVGNTFTLTATLEKVLGDGNAPVPAVGEIVNVSLSPEEGVSIQDIVDNCATLGTDANGQCTVSFTSPIPGKVTATAEATLTVEGLEITTSNGPVTALFVDGKVDITPEAVSTEDGQQTSFLIEVYENTGTGFVPVAGFTPVYTLPTGLSQDGGTCQSGVAITNGNTCTLIVINDAGSSGTFTIDLSASFGISDGTNSLVITRPDSATVTYVSALLSVVPDGEVNGIGEPHEFTVTVLQNDGNGNVGVPGVKPFVTINGADQGDNLCGYSGYKWSLHKWNEYRWRVYVLDQQRCCGYFHCRRIS